jgi:hypothetical protein
MATVVDSDINSLNIRILFFVFLLFFFIKLTLGGGVVNLSEKGRFHIYLFCFVSCEKQTCQFWFLFFFCRVNKPDCCIINNFKRQKYEKQVGANPKSVIGGREKCEKCCVFM